MSGEAEGARPSARWLIGAALALVWAYNGANYLAFKLGVMALPPLVLAALRFGAAALLILPLAAWRLRGRPTPTVRQLAAAGLLGVVMLIGGQTVSLWGVQSLPAGVAAVFASSSPLFLALFAWAMLRQPLGPRQLLGVGVGFAGLVGMGWSASALGSFHPVGAVFMLAAAASWAAGSLLAARIDLPEDRIVALTAQLVAAGMLLVMLAWATGELGTTDYAAVPARAWASLAFLVVVSSLIGYAAFVWLNATVSPTLANTFFYVAPVIALGLGALFLDEPLSWPKEASAAAALVGVILMVSGSRHPARAAPAREAAAS